MLKTFRRLGRFATRLLIVALCGFGLFGTATAAHAQVGAKMVEVDLPAQPLQSALRTLTDQYGMQILFNPNDVKGMNAPAIKGRFSPNELLEKLVDGTNLITSVNSQSAISIKPKSNEKKGSGQGGASTSGPTMVAQTRDQSAGETGVARPSEDDKLRPGKMPTQLEKIEITGSRLARAAAEGPQDVRVYTRERIEQSGQTTVAGYLNTLPSVSLAAGETQQTLGFGATTVRLRGLPLGTTLVLVNGHRVQTSGAQAFAGVFDLNNIPLAAVERIEVVANGSSAIYGSDAIAGVVNIILKSDFEGVELTARYGAANRTDESIASLAWGKNWGRGHVSFVGSYQSRGELNASDRVLTADNDYRGLGGTNNNQSNCNPGNVFFSGNGFSFNGQPAVAYAAVPAGLTGAPRVQDFASTAGTLNLCGPISQTLSVIPKAERFGALLAGDLVLSESVTVFGELLYSHTTQSAFISPLTLFGIPGFQLFTVGPSNPYNPFGTRVGIGYAFADTRSGAKVDTDFVRPLLGAKGTLGGDWTWELSVLQSQDYSHDAEIGAISNSATIQAALDSPNPGTALNPFGVGAPGSQSLLQTLFGDGLIKYRSRSQAVAGFARGPTFDLPAGAIEVVVGGEFSHDRLYSNFVSYPGHSLNEERTNTRHTAALFGEARVPILSGEPKGPPGGAVALTVAGRYDNYSDFGSSSNPQLGIEWRPLDTVLVRGTFAKAFKAPALDELYRPQTRSATVLVDPHVGHSVVVPVLSGGNPALEPMGGRSDTIGGIYSSRAIQGLEASVTLWRVKETNVIQTLTPQFVLNNESSFPERVIRDASGNLTSVDNSRVNFGAIDVAGLDYLVNYKYRTNLGDWSPSVAATQTYRYQTRLVAGAPARDRVSKADVGGWAPRLKGTVALGWNFGPYTVNIDGRFVSRYQDYGTTREIGNFWLFDANFRYMIGKALGIAHPLLKGTYVELGAVNIANTLPQYSNFNRFLGYDPTQADIRGRFLYLQLGMKL